MAHQEIAGLGWKRGDCRVSAHVAGKAVESQDKGGGLREDKTGHSGMNIHRKGHTALCMRGNRTKRKHTVYCTCIQYTSFRKKNPITLKCKSNIISAHPPPLHVVILCYLHQECYISCCSKNTIQQFTVNYSPCAKRTAQKKKVKESEEKTVRKC